MAGTWRVPRVTMSGGMTRPGAERVREVFFRGKRKVRDSVCPRPRNGYVRGAMTAAGNFDPKHRRSTSADAALRAEIQRVKRMTIEEPIRAALAPAERFSGMQANPHEQEEVRRDG